MFLVTPQTNYPATLKDIGHQYHNNCHQFVCYVAILDECMAPALWGKLVSQ